MVQYSERCSALCTNERKKGINRNKLKLNLRNTKTVREKEDAEKI